MSDRVATIPGPRGHWLWGSLPELRRDPLQLYSEGFQTYGELVRHRIVAGLAEMVVLGAPEAIERVLSRNHPNYRKPQVFLSAVQDVFGGGVFTSRGATWKRKRRLMAPAFRRDRLLDLAPTICETATRHLESWAGRAGERDVLADLTQLTLDVAARTLFGVDLGEDALPFAAALEVAFAQLGERLSRAFNPPLWVPSARNRALRGAIEVLRGVVARALAGRIAEPDRDRPDLLSRLLAARDEQGQGLSEGELIDEMITLLIAGHDTSAAGLAWTLHLLTANPEVYAEVEAEVDEVLGGRAPCAADLPRLELTRMAFEEALRLFPPAWGQPREAIGEDVLCGHRIAAGTLLVTSQWVVHRHPDHWRDPLRFDPRRFESARVAARHPFAYFPFGGGPRLCIGRQLALIEAPLLLAALLDRFRFDAGPGPVEPDPTFTLKPRGGLRLALSPRRS